MENKLYAKAIIRIKCGLKNRHATTLVATKTKNAPSSIKSTQQQKKNPSWQSTFFRLFLAHINQFGQKTVTLLGVVVDCHLRFDKHAIQLCKKINSKLAIFKKCTYLFDLNFKSILFKTFIQSRLEYCSSVFIHFSNNVDSQRLVKCFMRSIRSLLNVNLFGSSLSEQVNLLKNFNILPIQLRIFFHFNTFLFSILSFNNNTKIVKLLYKFKINNTYNLRLNFILPKINHDIKRYSFSIISIKILNCYLFKLVNNNISKNNFSSLKKRHFEIL
jgi:hypothetical protein